jgi:hypothetical protein
VPLKLTALLHSNHLKYTEMDHNIGKKVVCTKTSTVYTSTPVQPDSAPMDFSSGDAPEFKQAR